ncbi:NAD(P)-binding domain-containing protein [Amycolatopsis acidiphila]|uniref:2-hydroxy-3-oxopropionate reductase n=1 Tax=Amycolatopsis acidiphila TaxID=715473 RepID=A0A558A348_9PSEU|nr:NAD(P)-binding domain-containing protein [Amycolatopsis acidiphila]TVT18687.1 2-hydroxy-3-oxopropionate reductase [Amycolatopsis acidiphila]UIJ61575.1 NAD(P)-binding domain-containing protein [Amycolatopsis acidiphila]GHG59130.1 2-hydroxy-3-oxopropionate reductase [Amycolatopsis acidiphila]
MKKIGFIGLGIMGLPMAANLVKAGFDVTGHNRSRAKVDQFVEAGGRAADSVAEAVADADVVITMLPDSPDVQAVVLGEDGVVAHAEQGALLIDCSTIRPDVSREVAGHIRALDAPVSGGEQGAIEGNLSIMVGGAAEDFEAARDVLDAVGGTVVHVGAAGAGQTVKAANQLIVAGTIELVAESLVFLEAHDVDTEAAIKVLAGGLAGNRILDRKAAAMVRREFTPGFRVELHHKDLGIVQAAAREAGVVIPLGAAVAQLMAALQAQGHGGLDHGALLKLVAQLSGRE